MIINQTRNANSFDSSNVNEISGQKKRKLISNSNDPMKLKSKKRANMISLKKAREDGMKKRLLIVEGWDIAVDEDYVNKFRISNNDSEDNSNESNFS